METVIAVTQLLTFPVDGSTDVLKRIFHLGLKQTLCRHFHVLKTEEFLAISVFKTKSCETAIGEKNIKRRPFLFQPLIFRKVKFLF